MSPEIPLYDADNLPHEDPGAWGVWRKKVPTRAARIEGPFRVQTSESENEPFYCEDGYLAIDARGYPYAIAKEEFELIYEPEEPVEAKEQPASKHLVDNAQAWQGEQPAEGTRRALIRDTIRSATGFSDDEVLKLADAIELDLLRVEPAQAATPTDA